MNELKQIVGVRSDLTTARVLIALNQAQDKISQAQDFKEMQTYVTSATNYTGVPINDKFLPFSSSWKNVHSIVLQDGTDSRKLREIPWRKFDRIYPAPESVAPYIPLEYSNWNQQLIFMPVPNAVYPLQVRVTQYPTVFVQTPAGLNTTSQFNGKDDVIIAFAAAYLWRGFGRYDKAMEFENTGGAQLKLAMKADSNRPDLDTADIGRDSGLSGSYWANPFITSVN